MIFFIIYFLFPSRKKHIVLFLANIIFPLFIEVKCFVFINFEILSSYLFAILIEKNIDSQKKKKSFFILSLIFTIGILFIIKFLNFNISFISRLTGFTVPDYLFKFAAPLGIAYYSLSITSYLCDVYEKKIPAEKNFINYYVFSGYFLRLFQGPICRYDQNCKNELFLPKIITYEDVAHGAQLVLWGLFKKLVIADWLAVPVQFVYNGNLRNAWYGSMILFGTILFYIQLYCDFSGCIDIVKGCSQMIGIKLPDNFMHPFFATSVTDFWHRWHISLSNWLKDYIYIPLGGNKKGQLKAYLNIIIVFLISGLWHGSGLQFIFWGGMHAVIQIIEKHFTKKNKNIIKNSISKKVITFFIITITWIPFRADNIIQSIKYFYRLIFKFNFPILIQSLYDFGLSKDQSFVVFIAIILLFIIEFLQDEYKVSFRKKIDTLPLILRWCIYIVFICLIAIFGHYGFEITPEVFIYEQF